MAFMNAFKSLLCLIGLIAAVLLMTFGLFKTCWQLFHFLGVYGGLYAKRQVLRSIDQRN
ncbi:DUF2273 domain-containing protein [Streptococcus equi]|uniref:DUF2273 domain-containing protein n=1 Tax=Streptococcus equi TaxID=1336 RepID=UPI001E5CFC20|nr:DUF2273 domain-containing protein [Streptococcus equi]